LFLSKCLEKNGWNNVKKYSFGDKMLNYGRFPKFIDPAIKNDGFIVS